MSSSKQAPRPSWWVAAVVVIVVSGLLAYAGWAFSTLTQQQSQQSLIQTDGVVTRLSPCPSLHPEDPFRQRPIIHIVVEGKEWTVEGSCQSGPLALAIGDHVPVAYPAGKPEQGHVVVRSPFLFVIGGLFLLLALAAVQILPPLVRRWSSLPEDPGSSPS